MPVFTVSENTWPQVGFSRKRWMRPSSLTTTTPNSSGFSTRLRAMVANGATRSVELDDGGQVEIGERVAADDEEGLVAQVRLGQLDAARGAGRRLLHRVLHVHAQGGAVAEVVADGLRQERKGDHRLLDAVALQQLDDVLHARLAAEDTIGLGWLLVSGRSAYLRRRP